VTLFCSQASEQTLLLHMPALRRASFTASGLYFTSNKLHMDRDSFAAAAKLEFLSLTGLATVTLLPDCVSVLAGLATLELAKCGLISIPAALTALAGSLTRLAMRGTTHCRWQRRTSQQSSRFRS